ncbi:reverse transcriptase domain-containing protein [Tanacetum coccineum]
MDVFAWEPVDMTGVPRRIIEHNLNVNPSIEPEQQKRRVLSPKKSRVVARDVEEWVKAYIVRLPYLDCESGASCPKDYYLLPNIDCKVESVMGFKYKIFLDAYKGYQQIQMSKDDKEKMAFYTDQGTYCYTKMSFGLKNVEPTYQRLIDSIFLSQIGRNLEAYMDNMVVKSNDEIMLLADVAETFDNLRRINMKLNPKKCSFRVEEGNADLGRETSSPKQVFSKVSIKVSPLFNTLKNTTKENKHEYRWTIEAKEAFQQMNKCIMDLPSLTPPFLKETLYAYLAVSKEAVSFVLLTERKGKKRPIQCVSRTLNESERNYAPMEKLALSLVHMTRRLRRYFKAHPVKVITDQPIKQILNKTEASGKLGKYAVELGTYNITFTPRNAVKGQILADFISETPNGE